MATRPVEPPDAASAGALARELVERHGTDTLSFFKLRPDVARLFADDGSAFLGYATRGRTMLAGGDPVGPPEAVGGLIAQARAHARARGMRFGVLGASEAARAALETAGMRALYIGDEAIVETAAFSLAGQRMRKLRKPLHRFTRAGYRVALRRLGDLSEPELAELEALAERARDGRAEESFAWAMDGLRGAHQADCVVVVGRGPDGVAHGLLHFVPTYGRSAMSLSLMRRDPDAPNGLIDFLLVSAISLLRDRGIDEVSLNFAAFARWLREPANLRERVGARGVHVASRFIQMESLLFFNAKFRPRWEPRYLMYERRSGLLATGIAAMRVEGQTGRKRFRTP